VRCLQLVDRTVGRLAPAADGSERLDPSRIQAVETIDVDGRVFRGWQEAVEREIRIRTPLTDLLARPERQETGWPAGVAVEPLRTAAGTVFAAISRQHAAVHAAVDVVAAPLGGDLFKISLTVSNVGAAAGAMPAGRNAWLLRSLLSTHGIVQVVGGEAVSLADPPADLRTHADSCRPAGLWPVLVGEPADRDALLVSPIILYDHPQIAPESAGDFCDGTEIDEMLALRILTMTDAEKREMRESDERGRLMIERTESLSAEQMMRLHGVLRGMKPYGPWGAA
jgi:hydrogenase maturation protease